MNKHVVAMILLLLCLLASRPVEARLTLGVVTGSADAAGLITPEQAGSLASLLAEKLQVEVTVKEFSDSATLIDWLDRFAMLELALLSAKEVQENPGRFLQIEPFDEQGKLRLVCRQGVGDELPQRIAAIVREPGFVSWRQTAEGSSPAPEYVKPVATEVPSDVVMKPLPQPPKIAEPAAIEPAVEVPKVVPSDELTGMNPTLIDESTETEMWSDEEFAAMMGEDLVATVVAQPDIPPELRPSGVPVVRPGRIARRTTAAEDQLLIASLPEPRKNSVPPRPPNLLPEPEPEPGVVYVVPFISLMVPDEVDARVFDQLIDTLNREGEALNLQFVILKEGLQRVSPQWLSIRKYVTGEIYAYVEDSGCCSTDLRTRARLTYYRPHQETPVFEFEYPVKSFFDHDRSSLDVERAKLSDDIAMVLARELLKALQN